MAECGDFSKKFVCKLVQFLLANRDSHFRFTQPHSPHPLLIARMARGSSKSGHPSVQKLTEDVRNLQIQNEPDAGNTEKGNMKGKKNKPKNKTKAKVEHKDDENDLVHPQEQEPLYEYDQEEREEDKEAPTEPEEILPEHACAYCGLADVDCVIKCTVCNKWCVFVRDIMYSSNTSGSATGVGKRRHLIL